MRTIHSEIFTFETIPLSTQLAVSHLDKPMTTGSCFNTV